MPIRTWIGAVGLHLAPEFFRTLLPGVVRISLGLEKARTQTLLSYEVDEHLEAPEIEFLFEGRPAPAFEARIVHYIHSLLDRLPALAWLAPLLALGMLWHRMREILA